jgi:hypothetical protein
MGGTEIVDWDSGFELCPVVIPEKTTVALDRVDLTDFRRPIAKIDCITISCKEEDRQGKSLKDIRSKITCGTLEIPRIFRNHGERGCPQLAFHDPSTSDLQFLIERFPESRVLYIEFAVDFRLPDGDNDLNRLKVLKAQLRHCLLPQKHKRLKQGRRKAYSIGKKRYLQDGVQAKCPDTQILFEAQAFGDRIALYVKETNNGTKPNQPWVRIEARLEGSGPGAAGLRLVGMLPHFAENLRKYLSPMMHVGCGYKNSVKLSKIRGYRKDAWTAWGAQWQPGWGLVAPDVPTKEVIGYALNDLRGKLKKLHPPTAFAHRYAAWVDENTI